MKRSFKVATVFAGVGAAGGLFAPAAMAAPTRATTAARPDINPAKECGTNKGGVSTWVHLYYPQDDHPAECITGAGYESLAGTIYSICPGNNYGRLFAKRDASFWAGGPRVALGNDYLLGISIWSWSGHAKC
jgi:hypothetical protein